MPCFARVSALFIFLANAHLSIWSSGSYLLITYADQKRCYPSIVQPKKLGYCHHATGSSMMMMMTSTKNETATKNEDKEEPSTTNDNKDDSRSSQEELGSGGGRKERKKRQRQADYERRRKLWLDRYGSAAALRSTFGSGPPWGDLTPQQTRAFYHILLPRSLLALSEMGLMKPDELAPLAYEARIAAKEYARSRCVWTGRVATAVFDQYRSLRDRGRLIGPGSSSSMSWEEVWEKYEAQIVEEECAEVIDESNQKETKKKKKKEKKLWGGSSSNNKEESLTMRIYMRILERSCATNKAFDSLFLRNDDNNNNHKGMDLAAIATQLENDIHSILLSPKENIKREKKMGKMTKKLEKDKEREEKRQRKVQRKKEEERRKEQRKQEKQLLKKEHHGTYQDEDDEEEEEEELWQEDENEEDGRKKGVSTEHFKRIEALRILASTRRQFRTLFPKKETNIKK